MQVQRQCLRSAFGVLHFGQNVVSSVLVFICRLNAMYALCVILYCISLHVSDGMILCTLCMPCISCSMFCISGKSFFHALSVLACVLSMS
ncbi:hypothetical protein FKM82_023507 [Ascaphus truei]